MYRQAFIIFHNLFKLICSLINILYVYRKKERKERNLQPIIKPLSKLLKENRNCWP